MVSRKNGGTSGRAGFERGCIRDTARIQRVLIGDRYALQLERVIFYLIIPDQAIKIGRHWSGVGRLSGVNVAEVGPQPLSNRTFLWRCLCCFVALMTFLLVYGLLS